MYYNKQQIKIILAFIICAIGYGTNALPLTSMYMLRPLELSEMNDNAVSLDYNEDELTNSSLEGASLTFKRNCFFSPVQCMFRRSSSK
ncbi:unnamed protein product [Anisakis simplex]|uniref:Uncharacterized protein n=2 Tax=Anisakis simplex TaxID=6269 RepID=A0A0M3K7W6_ANISI|nr:unnamed protein product [Anisakis simplex]